MMAELKQDVKQEFYRPRDAAVILGVSEKQVRRLVLSGKLAGLKIGGQVRITREGIDKMIARAGTVRE
jgi:excisionase family DNA binding protein